MHISNISLKANSSYRASGSLSYEGRSVVSHDIVLETDARGELTGYQDVMGNDPQKAELWEYLRITDQSTGEEIDLRLLTAAYKGDLMLASEALADNVDLNLRSKGGGSALHFAAAFGHLVIVKLLVSAGIDIDALDGPGHPAIAVAHQLEKYDIVEYLHMAGANLTIETNGSSFTYPFDEGVNWGEILLEGAANSDLAIVRHAIAKGAPIDTLSNDGWTPLLEAASGHPQVCDYLISSGCNINISSPKGYTALMRAAGSGNEAVTQILLAAGADCSATDASGQTALDMAEAEGEVETATILRNWMS